MKYFQNKWTGYDLISLAYFILPINAIVNYYSLVNLILLIIYAILYILILRIKPEYRQTKFTKIIVSLSLVVLFIMTITFHITVGFFCFFYIYNLPYGFRIYSFRHFYSILLLSYLFLSTIGQYVFHHDQLFIILSINGLNLMIYIININQVKSDRYKQQIRNKELELSQLRIDNERNRIANDLHDTLGHTFVTINTKAQLAQRMAQKSNLELTKELYDIESITSQALSDVRRIIDDMSSYSIEEEIKSSSNILNLHGIEFEYVNNVESDKVEQTRHITYIIRECVNNVIKHSQATKVCLELINHKYHTEIIFKDNGEGMNNPKPTQLKSINERVGILTGSMNVQSDNGLYIDIKLPKGDKI